MDHKIIEENLRRLAKGYDDLRATFGKVMDFPQVASEVSGRQLRGMVLKFPPMLVPLILVWSSALSFFEEGEYERCYWALRGASTTFERLVIDLSKHPRHRVG